MHSLSKLGDIEHVRHLEPYLRKFLEDHPEPSRNVFIMMRFSDSPDTANSIRREIGIWITRDLRI
jgi:hypothetical protein